MQAKASKIVILCCDISIFYPINYYKNFQNVKNLSANTSTPSGGGVWYDDEFLTSAHKIGSAIYFPEERDF